MNSVRDLSFHKIYYLLISLVICFIYLIIVNLAGNSIFGYDRNYLPNANHQMPYEETKLFTAKIAYNYPVGSYMNFTADSLSDKFAVVPIGQDELDRYGKFGLAIKIKGEISHAVGYILKPKAWLKGIINGSPMFHNRKNFMFEDDIPSSDFINGPLNVLQAYGKFIKNENITASVVQLDTFESGQKTLTHNRVIKADIFHANIIGIETPPVVIGMTLPIWNIWLVKIASKIIILFHGKPDVLNVTVISSIILQFLIILLCVFTRNVQDSFLLIMGIYIVVYILIAIITVAVTKLMLVYAVFGTAIHLIFIAGWLMIPYMITDLQIGNFSIRKAMGQ